MSRSEEGFLAWLERRLPAPALVGDDTAELAARGRLVVTVDQQIEGTHFSSGFDPYLLGRRLVAVNLSDLAASGARPRWALLALGVPPELDPRLVVEGVLDAAREHGLVLAGGDLAHTPLVTTSLTLVGEKDRRDAPLGRDRARAGHDVWLGGPVGESALGCELVLRGARADRELAVRLPKAKDLPLPRSLAAAARRAVARHLAPEPQLALGRWLASLGRRAGAAIDVSDGLAKDLRRICTASGVGCELDLRLLRAALPARFEELAAAVGLDPVALALGGGEDYALLFSLPAGLVPPARFAARRVGRVVRGRRCVVLDGRGVAHPLPVVGWDHLETR